MEKVGLGGGCHWCTEAVFLSLRGVERVRQGWIKPSRGEGEYSEGVVVYFNPEVIDLKLLLEIHLITHSSSSNHSMRKKYRSAVYCFDDFQEKQCRETLASLEEKMGVKVVTAVLPFGDFKLNEERYLNYHGKNPEAPFCKTYIDPKLKMLLEKYRDQMRQDSNPKS